MPPRPPSSSQGEAGQQNRNQSPMASTQSYGQPMMPPSMGGPPGGQMGGYGGPSSKMMGGMMGGPGGPMASQYNQQNPQQYPNQPQQGQFGRQPGMQGYGQSAYGPMYPGSAGPTGPGGPMGGMTRGPMGNSSYPGGYPGGPQNSMMGGGQYGGYNNSGAPQGMPPNQSVGQPQPTVNNMGHMNNMAAAAGGGASTGGMPPASAAPVAPPSVSPVPPPNGGRDLHSPGPKGAQVAAQQAMLAAANSARLRQNAANAAASNTSSPTPPIQPPQTSPVPPQLSPSQPPTSQPNPPSSAGPPVNAGGPHNMPPNITPNIPPNRSMYPGYGNQHGPMPGAAGSGQYPMNHMPPGGQPNMESNMGPGGMTHNGPVPHNNYSMPSMMQPGPHNQMGGPHNQMGGPHNQMGGPNNQMGGSHGQMGGVPPHNQMPGHPSQMGGPPNHMGSHPNQMGGHGHPNQMGNQMGGPQMSGPMGPNHHMPGMPMGGPHHQGPPASMHGNMPPSSMGPGQQPGQQPGQHANMVTDNGRSNTPQHNQSNNSMPNSMANSNSDSNDGMKMSNAGNSTTVTQSISTPMTNASELTTTTAPSMASGYKMPPPPPKRESGFDSQGENSNDEPPEKRSKSDNASHPPTPVAPSPSASMSSVHDDFDNMSSPSWPGTPAFTPSLSEAPSEKPQQKPNEGVNKLYDMGEEPERRPFLDKLFSFMDDKGAPINAMPVISKQPIDLFKLYVLVKEKGGILEVTKHKKWRDICAAINIGSSGSAGFTLRKNYIKFLLSFECKFEHGGIDPGPIIQQLESMSDKKSKTKQGQNMGKSGGPGMNFQGQPTGGYDGFPPQQGHPGMGGVPPGPPHMMNPNMAGYNHPAAGGMMNNSGMPPNTSVMPQGNAMMGNNMMPNRPMMPNNGDSVAVTDPFADSNMGAAGQGNFPRPGFPNNNMGQAAPNFPGGNPGYNRPPGAMAGNFPPSAPGAMPPGGGPGGGGGGQYDPAMTPRGPTNPNEQHYPNDPYRRGMAPGPDGYQSRGLQGQEQQGFTSSSNTSSSSQYSGPNRGPQVAPNPPQPSNLAPNQGSTGTPTPPQYSTFSQPGPDNRHEGNQGPPPSSTSSSQMGGTPGWGGTSSSHPPSSNTQQDPMYSGGRGFPPTQPRPLTPQDSQYGMQTPPPPPHSGGSPAPNQYPPNRGYPGGQEYPQGGYQGGMYPQNKASMGPGNYPTPQKRFPDDFHRRDGYNMPPGGGRDQWSRYPQQPGSPFHQGGVAPGQRQGYGMYNQPNNRMSPQRPDAKPYASPSKQQKGGQMHGGSGMQGKRDIIFPPESVEAVQPILVKRHRLNHKDIGPTDLWRVVLSLKSGLLAESTWALDTLSILLFDDNTIPFFQLHHLPSLLEALLDQYRRCLIEIFPDTFKDLEESLDDAEDDSLDGSRKASGDTLREIDMSAPDEEKLDQPENYTLVTRHGRPVKIEKDSPDLEMLFDEKEWDRKGHTRGALKNGLAIRTDHICTHLEQMDKLEFYRQKFFGRNSKYTKKQRKSAKVNASDAKEDCERCASDNRVGCKAELDDALCETSSNMNGDKLPESDCMPNLVENSSSSNTETSPSTQPHNPESIDSLSNVQIKTEPPDPSSTTPNITNSELHHNSISCSSSSSPPRGESPAPPPSHTDTEITPKSEPESPAIKDEASSSIPDSEGVKTESDGTKTPVSRSATPSEPEAESSSDTARTSTSDAAREAAYKRHLAERALNDAGIKIVEDLRQQWEDGEEDKEAYCHNEPPLFYRTDAQEELARRTVCISNIFRGLSCVPGNERKLSESCGLMKILGRLLLLHHWHPKRRRDRPKPTPVLEMDEDMYDEQALPAAPSMEEDDGGERPEEWWWECLEELRENTLVVCANMAGKLSLSIYPQDVIQPYMDGLLHWSVCASSYAQDPLPTVSPASVLSAQRLVLETLCKLCIQEDNVDLLLATAPFSRIAQLFRVLSQLLANRKEQVLREFAIVLLSSLVGGDAMAARLAALTNPVVPLLVDFLESSEQQALNVANSHGVDMLRESPEMMGTSLGMLRRAATTLLHLAKVRENRPLFMHQEQRLLQLVMSQILDQHVASILADVLYHCSLHSSTSGTTS